MIQSDNLLDSRIKLLTKYFDLEDIVIAGGMAVYLATGSYRETDDMDLIQLNENIGRKKSRYSLDARIKVDLTQIDSVFDSFDLSTTIYQAIKTKEYESGERVLYLGREGLLTTKMTSLCVSGDEGQMTEYGFKILRDRDITDIKNLRNESVDKKLIDSMLETVPQLEEIRIPIFHEYFNQVIDDKSGSIAFKKNAYGVARVISHPSSEQNVSYEELRKNSEYEQVSSFARKLNEIYNHLWSL